ncbi:MFS transporter [Arthrobacter sp. zg-Y1219]|uniref:MFS transporter n=1 Tax=Arthrobacter sp. zg-Y1219 TaxID=3049067 RepID=UPI0024C3F8AD|nr:MFS transporter [Arthrobacter sp. zg-Y1219]MDK1360810.1 MFS transporter [Arthrobacter sp. zg-Y1219]
MPAVQEASPIQRAGRREWLGLAVLMLPVLLISVDNTVLSFAIPSLSRALAPTGTELLWIVDIYALVLAGLLVPMGALGDRIGRRRLLLIGGAGFGLVSAAAAFVPSAEALIGARALLGLFGAMLMPATLSLIRNIFTVPSQRRIAIAVWAAGFSGGAALGPIVGGLLLEHFWWGSVFLLSVPVLIPLLVLGPILLPESRDPHPGPVDLWSVLLVMAAMFPVVYGIKAISTSGVGVESLLPIAVGLMFGVLFVRRQLRRLHPMLDVRLFRNPTFSGSIGANLLSVFSLVGFIFFLSQHLQLVLEKSPQQAGLIMLPGLLLTIIAGLAVVRVVRHIRPGYIIAGGLLLNAVGYTIILAAGGDGGVGGLMVAFMVLGLGVGAAETISNDLILSSVPPTKAGAASAISETAYEVGAVLGTAVLGSILTAGYRNGVVLPGGLAPADAAAASETLGGAVEAAQRLPEGSASALLESARAAFDSGVTTTSLIGVVLMLVASAGAVVMLRRATADS